MRKAIARPTDPPVRLLRPGALGAVAILVLTSCVAMPDRERIHLGGELYGASVNGSLLSIEVPTCNGEREVAVLEETPEVRVEVVSQRQRGGDDCLDGVRVELDLPLGDRALIDVTSGRTLQVDGR